MKEIEFKVINEFENIIPLYVSHNLRTELVNEFKRELNRKLVNELETELYIELNME
jgi:hypothetical protein